MALPFAPKPWLLDRRRFLAAGAGALAAASLAGRGRRASAATGGTTPFFLIVYASGGWDTAMVFENKLGNGYVATESDAQAATGGGNLPYINHASRPAVKSFFDAYGANCAIVNGLATGSLDHRAATQHLLGAVPSGQDRCMDWGTFYAANLNPTLPLPHVVIDAPFMPGQSETVATRLTTAEIAEYTTAFTGADTLGSAGETALSAYRTAAYTGVDKPANTGSLDAEKLRALASGEQRETVLAAALTQAQQTVGTSTTDATWVHNGKLAIELFAQGASLAATLQAGPDGLFDTTTNHFARATAAYQDLFTGLSALLQYAAARSVSNLTLLVVSECGRAPLLNAQQGKGPWPYTSALLWGPLINGGTVAGLTDQALRGVPIDPVFGGQTGSNVVVLEMAHLMAALYLRVGAPATQIVGSVQPLTQVIKES